MAEKKVPKDTKVAYMHTQPGEEWPGKIKWDGPGFYEVLSDEKDDHTQADFGKRLEYRLNNPPEPGVTPDPEDNEGHFVYADSVKEEGGADANGNG